MKAMFKLEMWKNMQDKGLIFWTFILPIIFTVLFISILTSTVNDEVKESIITSIIPGYTVMFVFFIIIAMGTSFLQDRDTGFVARLASTPLSPIRYVVGKSFSFALVLLIQIFVLLTFGKVVYTVTIEQPVPLLMLSLGLIAAVVGIGLFISVTIPTNNMGIAITQVIALVGAIIGGLWFPLDTMPTVIQNIGVFTPQYWAHDGFQQAMTGTLSVPDFLRSIGVLLLYSAIGLIGTIITYPIFLRRAKS